MPGFDTVLDAAVYVDLKLQEALDDADEQKLQVCCVPCVCKISAVHVVAGSQEAIHAAESKGVETTLVDFCRKLLRELHQRARQQR